MKKNGLTFLITTLVLALFYILTGAFAASSAKMPKSVYSTVEARTSSGGEPLSNKTSNVVLDLGDGQVNKIYAFVGEVRSWHTDEKDGDYINLVFDFGPRSDSFLEGAIYNSRIGANKENRIYLNGRTNLYRWIKIYDGGEKTVGYDRVRFHTSDDTDVAELAFLDKKGKLISASIVQHSSFEGEKNYGGLIDEQAYFTSSQSKAYNFTDKELDEISAINAIVRGEKFVGYGFLNTLLNVVGTKIFGVNTFGLRFFSMLAGFASLLLVYYIVEMLFGRSEISALATLLALCSGQIFSASLTAMSQGVFERRERRTRSCWPVIRQLIFNAALPHSGQRRSVTEHQLPCCGEVKTTSHIPRTKIGQMEPHSQNFFQIFFHSNHAALHRASDNTLVHALLPSDLAIALAEDQMRLYPDALHLRQRVEGVPQVDKQLHAIQKLLRRRLMQAGRVFDPIVTVEGYCALLRVVRR